MMRGAKSMPVLLLAIAGATFGTWACAEAARTHAVITEDEIIVEELKIANEMERREDSGNPASLLSTRPQMKAAVASAMEQQLVGIKHDAFENLEASELGEDLEGDFSQRDDDMLSAEWMMKIEGWDLETNDWLDETEAYNLDKASYDASVDDWIGDPKDWLLDTNDWLMDANFEEAQSQAIPELKADCPKPRNVDNGGWKVALVIFGTIGILGSIVYSAYSWMGPIGLGQNAVSVRSLQGLNTSQIKGHFQAHPEIFSDTMLRGFEANPDGFTEMLVRSGLFKIQPPNQSFMQRSFRTGSKSISSIFGRKEHNTSQFADNQGDEGSLV